MAPCTGGGAFRIFCVLCLLAEPRHLLLGGRYVNPNVKASSPRHARARLMSLPIGRVFALGFEIGQVI